MAPGKDLQQNLDSYSLDLGLDKMRFSGSLRSDSGGFGTGLSVSFPTDPR